MADEIHFIDTTFRDGSQSLWAMGMRHGMMEPLAADMDRAGFFAVEVIPNGIFFKKIVRDLKEDPWHTLRMLSERMPRTLKTCMGALNLVGLGTSAPRVVQELALQMVADIVQPYRPAIQGVKDAVTAPPICPPMFTILENTPVLSPAISTETDQKELWDM